MAPHNGQLTQNLREEHRTLKTLLNRAHQAMLSNEWGPATRTLLQLQSLMNEHLMQEHLQLYAHVLWSEQVSTGYKAAIRKHQGEMNLLFSRTSQLLSRLLHLKPEGRPEALREFCELKVLWIEGLVREELDLFLVYDSLHLHPEVEMA